MVQIKNIYSRYKYPLEENVKENEAEDKRCLAKVEAILEDQVKKGVPCVGMIVEPIQSEGGDHHGSSAWFQVSLEFLLLQSKDISTNFN